MEKTNRDQSFLKKIVKNIKEYAPVITTFQVLIVVVYSVYNNTSRYLYSLDAANFYGIPRKYFYNNLLGERITIIIYISAYIFMLLSPIIIKRVNKKNVMSIFESMVYTILIAPVIGFGFTVFSIEWLTKYTNFHYPDDEQGIFLIISLIVTCILFFYIFRNDFSNEKQDSPTKNKRYKEKHNLVQKGKKWTKHKKIYKAKHKRKLLITQTIIMIIFSIQLVIHLICMSTLLVGKNNVQPRNIKKYEIATIQKDTVETKVAVITEKDGKLLVMDIEVSPDKKNLEFKDRNYYFVDSKDCTFEYIYFESVKFTTEKKEEKKNG